MDILSNYSKAHSKYPNNVRFDLDANQIANLAKDTITFSKKTLDEIATMPPSFDVLLRLSDEDTIVSTLSSSCVFPSYVSPSKEVRDASTAANRDLEAYRIEKSFRDDIYRLVKAYSEVHDESKHTPEENRLLKKTLEEFDRNGLGLEEDRKKRLQEVKKELSDICIRFQQNLNEDVTHLTFSAAELEGMPKAYLDGLEKDGDRYKVSLEYPQLFPLLKSCTVVETRRLMDIAKEKQCVVENTPLLERAIVLRQEEAKLLGFDSHADYILAVRMAKNPQNVMKFLNDLNERLTPLLEKDIAEMLELKKQDAKDNFDGKIHSHDYRFYYNKILETRYQVQDDIIQEYFPLDHVTNEMLKVYQEVLGLVFTPTADPHVWHEDVAQYDVKDAETGAFIGHFYLDLHPREGKYGHAAEFDLQKGCEVAGKRQYPAAAMVANFTKPTKERRSLLKHSEVETYFHEFGHVMHELMSHARFSMFAGTNVERDFVETPSQMLENWCFEKTILERMSRHFETGESLPEKYRQQLVAARYACSGLLYKRQLFFGYFDMALHTATTPVKAEEVWRKLRKEVAGIEAPAEGNGAASFGHLMGGYSAGYYGYLWSEVFSADLFEEFKRIGILDRDVGGRYRRHILAPGGTKDASDLLKDFLGREPTPDAFLIQLGLQES